MHGAQIQYSDRSPELLLAHDVPDTHRFKVHLNGYSFHVFKVHFRFLFFPFIFYFIFTSQYVVATIISMGK